MRSTSFCATAPLSPSPVFVICIEACEENINCHANERQIKFKTRPPCCGSGAPIGGSTLVQGAKHSVGSSPSAAPAADHVGTMTSEEQTEREMPKTIVFCAAGAEPRRVQGGQRLLSGGCWRARG